MAEAEASVLIKLQQQNLEILDTLKQKFAEGEQGVSRFQAQVITLNQALELGKKAYQAVSAVVGTVAGVIGDAIEASNQQEEAIAGLNATLRSSGQFTEEYSSALQELAGEFQSTTKFGDETVLSVEQMLVAMGAAPNQVARLTQASLDLAVGLKGANAGASDATSAAQLLGKAVAGEFGTLSRYGIIVEEGATKSEKLDQALAQIEERFGGQASAAAQTFSGQVAQVNNIIGDLYEVLGDAVKGSAFLTDALTLAKDTLLGLQGTLGENRAEFAEWIDTAIKAAALAFIDFTAILFSVGDAVETMGAKLGAMGAIAVGLATGDLELVKAGWSGLFEEVETNSEAGLAVLADLRAKVEGLGQGAAVAKPSVEGLGDATGTVGDEAETAAGKLEKMGAGAKKSATDIDEVVAGIAKTFDAIKAEGDLTLEARFLIVDAEERLQDLRNRIAKEEDEGVKVKLKLELRDAEKELDDLRDGLRRDPFVVLMEMGQVKRQAEELRDDLEEAGEDVPLNLREDKLRLRETIDRIRQQVEMQTNPEIKVKMQARLEELEASMSAKREEEESDPIVIPVEGDTSGLDGAIDESRQGKGPKMGSVNVQGDPALPAEILAAARRLEAEARAAASSGDAAAVQRAGIDAREFLDKYEDGLRLLANPSGIGSVFHAFKAPVNEQGRQNLEALAIMRRVAEGLPTLSTSITQSFDAAMRVSDDHAERRHSASIATFGRMVQKLEGIEKKTEEAATETRQLKEGHASGRYANPIVGALTRSSSFGGIAHSR